MNTISIAVKSEEFETINIELSQEEVTALYNLRKENSKQIESLTKELEQAKTNKKHQDDRLEKANEEVGEAHTLLTALGVKDKTDHEESYYRKDLKVSTRIALYIAANK